MFQILCCWSTLHHEQNCLKCFTFFHTTDNIDLVNMYTNNIKKNGEVIDQKKWRGQRPLARSMETSKDAEYIFIN